MTTQAKPLKFIKLKEKRDALYGNILQQAKWINYIMEEEHDRRLYGMILTEIYHCTRHDLKHQELGTNPGNAISNNCANFLCEIAKEETRNAMMAFYNLFDSDLMDKKSTLPEPLNTTKILIDYLDKVSTTGNSLGRLGYSFWRDEDNVSKIEAMLCKYCTTEEDWNAVEKVMEVSMRLKSNILNEVVEEYIKLKEVGNVKYDYLEKLAFD